MIYRSILLTAFLICWVAAINSADEFPGTGTNCPDIFPTEAAFKIVTLSGIEITISNLYDSDTIIGRGEGGEEGDSEDDTGRRICGAGPAGDFPNTRLFVPDACRKPGDWPETPDSRREVPTEVLSLNLVGDPATIEIGEGFYIQGTVAIRAGQDYYDSVSSEPQWCFFRNSIGEVASLYSGEPEDFSKDFPARNCFNVYVEIEVEINHPFFQLEAKLYNKMPMVLQAPITQFPPDLSLPNSTYIHDPTFGAVPLYNAFGLPFGYLLSAGHGWSSGGGFPPDPENAPFVLPCPVSFTVDEMSDGLDHLLTGMPPNDVFSDPDPDVQKVTMYLSSGAYPGGPPDASNAHSLVGGVGDPTPPGFAPGDTINSFSFGQDGTVQLFDPLYNPGQGVLYFSVSRLSEGKHGSDVYLNAADSELPAPEAAADVYVSTAEPFGKYQDFPGIAAKAGDNLLGADNRHFGLRRLLCDVDQDNITGLEINAFNSSSDLWYGTFVGPSFVGSGSTIYVYNPASGLFEFGNLVVFSDADDMGLQEDDIIDALALSDINSDLPVPPSPDGLKDPDLDEALFSLAPGSTTLSATGLSPAHIFYSDFDGTFSVFATPPSLGLEADTDDVDAADIKGLAEPGFNSKCIEFDEYPGTLTEIPSGTRVNLTWVNCGVVIDAFSFNGADDPGVYTGRPGDHPDVEDCIPVSGENFIKTSMEAGDQTSDAGVFTFAFINPYNGSPMTCSKVGVYFLDVEEINAVYVPDGTSRLVAFDNGGAELGAVWVPFGSDGQQYYAEISAPGIGYCKAFVGQPDPGGDSGALDNFCYTLELGCTSGLEGIHRPARASWAPKVEPVVPKLKRDR